MNDDIRARAERELEALRAARGLPPRLPSSLGLLFPPTPGRLVPDGEWSTLLPVPLDEWAAPTYPWTPREPQPPD